MEFLLSTLPKESAKKYKKKLQVSINFWRDKGGCLSGEVIEKLRALKVQFTVAASTNYKTDKSPVRMEYLDDIEINEFREIPTYKRVCICILKNDFLMKYAGFTLTKTETQIRAQAEKKYRDILVAKEKDNV